MIELNWGAPLTFVVSQHGDTQKFTTIEQALYWLRKKWPVADRARDFALEQVDAAMDCMTSVGAARKAFIAAAGTAGFRPGHDGAGIVTAGPQTTRSYKTRSSDFGSFL